MWLCIDQGGHSTRAVAFDEAGVVAAEGAAALETRVSHGDFVEHGPAQLLDSVGRALQQVSEQLGDECIRLEAAGVASQRSTLVCVSRSTGVALTPVMSWQDRRGADDLARFEAHEARVKEITGLRVSPHYGVGKLRWCLRHLDIVRDALARGDLMAAPLASYLLQQLCPGGDWRVDPASASRTLLMDVRSLDWSAQLLDLFQIPRDVLPRIVPCRYSYGHVRVGNRDVPLVVSTGDQSAAVYCTGAPEPGTAFINVGTGAFIQCFTGTEPVFDERLLSSIVWQADTSRGYVLEGTVNGAASAVDAIAAELGYPEPPHASELDAVFADMEETPLFLNGVSGLGSPDWVARFPTRFEGDGTRKQKLAAVYESIAFLIMRNLERMGQRLELERVVMSGGLSQVDWLVEQVAALSGLTVVRHEDPEATLHGLAYLVSGGVAGAQDARAAREFSGSASATTRRRYGLWKQAMERLLTLR